MLERTCATSPKRAENHCSFSPGGTFRALVFAGQATQLMGSWVDVVVTPMPDRDVLSIATAEATAAMQAGVLRSPDEAKAAGGTNIETLWSISTRVAGRMDDSAEAIFEYLERQFPQYRLDKRRLERRLMDTDTNL